MNDKGVCRTAPATPGLLNITPKNLLYKFKFHNNFFYKVVCNFCDYKVKYCSNLNDHIEAVHKGIAYNCDACKQKLCFMV